MTVFVDKLFCALLIFIVFLSGFLLGLLERGRYQPKGPYDEFRPLNKPTAPAGRRQSIPDRKPLPKPQKEDK